LIAVSVAANLYLAGILKNYTLPTGPASPAAKQARLLLPTLRVWASPYLAAVRWTGSYAKGTRVAGATDIDIFLSLKSSCPGTLKDIFRSLLAFLPRSGWSVVKGNVAATVTVAGFRIDVVAGRKQRPGASDHSLYRSRGDTWIQTNPDRHVAYVVNSRHVREIRLTKIFRNLNRLEFPSFYLELAVIEALRGHRGGLSSNFATVLEYLASDFTTARIVDPANSNNVVSDIMTAREREAVAARARAATAAQYWEKVVW
jgi:hypothetical protein